MNKNRYCIKQQNSTQ